MRLGIFGGTFNPVHAGHVTASLVFYDDMKLDKLLVIPDRIPPHKEGKVASAFHRLNMLRIVYCDKNIVADRNIEISEMELMREGKSYTVVTLRELREKYPDAELCLYVGSDMFYTLESWREGSTILSMCTVYTAAREENEYDRLCEYAVKYRQQYGTECIIAKSEPVVLSSTEIREYFERQNDKNSGYFTNSLLTEGVNRYIMENNLYSDTDIDKITARVRADLPSLVGDKRLRHILGVVGTAELLADFFEGLGAESLREKAVLSALLHDVTKYMDQEELCRKYGITLSEDDMASMQMVHAVTGACYASEVYGVSDEISSAVKCHTVGKEDMNLLEKIIFVSDYCEETRVHEQCIKSREMLLEMMANAKKMSKDTALPYALTELDRITADILGKTVKYLRDSGYAVHRTTVSSFKSITEKYKDDSRFDALCRKYTV